MIYLIIAALFVSAAIFALGWICKGLSQDSEVKNLREANRLLLERIAADDTLENKEEDELIRKEELEP